MSDIKNDPKLDDKDNLAVGVNSYPKNIQELTDYVNKSPLFYFQ